MDTGSACSRYNIYGQMVYWEVTSWTILLEYGCLLLGDEAIYYAKWMISTGRYHDDVHINQWNFYLLHTSHVDYTVSSSDVAIIDVCIY